MSADPAMAGPYAIGSDHWPGTSKLIEEMGELQQVLGKLLATNGKTAHWDGTDLRLRLMEELADVKAAISFFTSENLDPAEWSWIDERKLDKCRLFEKWQREQGLND